MRIYYTILFNENVKEILCDKLTVMFNKTVNSCKAHVQILLPLLYDSDKISHYKKVYDEIAIQRFKPESRFFWNSRNLIRYSNYISNIDLDEKTVLISQGQVFSNIKLEDCDIGYSGLHIRDNISSSQHSLITALEEAGYELKNKEFDCYNFSCCYFSGRCKKLLYFKLSEILDKLQIADVTGKENCIRYFDQDGTNVLLSMLVSEIKDELKDVKFLDMNPDIHDINENLVEHFYSLI